MANVVMRKGWEMDERRATTESAYVNRRKFLKAAGLMGAASILPGCRFDDVVGPVVDESWVGSRPPQNAGSPYPARTNPRFASAFRKLTDEGIAGAYNNFYEFDRGKTGILEKARDFVIDPWKLEVKGLVDRPVTLDYDDLHRRFPLEERLYRLRCVEAWSMAIPWTGFPMKALIDLVSPQSRATYVRFTSFFRPAQAPYVWRNPDLFPWPYREGLRLDEAMNELTFISTGIYGHKMPKQHGAPVRLVVPWKYGFKSSKSIVTIEFVEERPKTFWNDLFPDEYGFFANVEPDVPHSRWSQATEKFITDDVSNPLVVPTILHNGYQEFVQHLYR